MNVLIVTEPDDIHAALVKLALEAKGVNCKMLFSADMPSIQKNNIFISNFSYTWSSQYNLENHTFGDNYDSIWWRRPRRPYLPKNIHDEDVTFVRKENSIYHDSLPFILNEQAWWVNPISSHQKSKSKIVQLKAAQSCQFKLPETLISNSPETIRNFIQSSNKNTSIYKSFSPQFWMEKEGMKLLYTNKVSLDDLPEDAMLQAVPGIYQRYIEKKYELRVTCFGTHISAVKIESQKHELGLTDWRKIPGGELEISEATLSPSIRMKIFIFMKKMGVVFGCFDFIVTPDDQIVFLEFNEQGQFLWVEEIYPDLCYLDLFCQFLIDKSFYFSWSKTASTLHATDFDVKAQELVDNNVAKHVCLNKIERVA